MTRDAWSERLSEYLDGELDGRETRKLEQHLEACDRCRQDLAELSTVVTRLAAGPLTGADQPTRREWEGIRRRIRAPRRRWMIPAAIAAALAALALGTRLRPRSTAEPGTAASSWTYVRAASELETILRANESRLRPETVQALEASLRDIDSAMVRAERALAADPANDYVIRSVGRLREARLTVLRSAAEAALGGGS